MAHFEKHFTLDEANALLPELRELLLELQTIRETLIIAWQGARPVLQAAHQNGGGQEAHPYLGVMHRLNARVERLAGLGVQLKDLDKGLVDFPAWRGDDEIFLCWHLGEDRVEFWHDLDSGYSGRLPL